MGYLYLNTDSNILDDGVAEEQASTYTGKTYVGNVGGDPNGKAVTVIFGKNNAFGSTSNLYIHDDSSVWFADKDLKTRHTQTVGGLTGEGELNFGNAAEVTLKQTSTGNGYTDTNNGVVRVDNAFTGASADGGGAVFNIDLSALKLNVADPVRGSDSVYEIFFTDQPQKDAYTGLITLTGGAVTAYNQNHSQNFTGVADPYTNLNGILLGSTLQLKQDGWVRVDSRGELNSLIIDSGAGGIDFSNLGNVVADGEGALTINGNLTFSGADATVSIKDFNYNIGEAAAGMDLIDADDGLLNTLVHVKGDVVGEENYGFVLDEASQQEKPVVSAIKDDSGTPIASGTWVLEDELRYDGSGNFDLAYKLTQVDIKEDQTLTISGSDKASEASKTQDFTAKITGSGNIVFNAADNATGSGTRIEIGDASTTDKNDYTGSTTVTDGTTLVLTEDDAMGQTSDLIAYGNVEIGSGIEQTVKNINSSGSGTISIAKSGKLTVDASGDQTINNIISGAGDLNIDLGGSGNKLVFGNSGQGSSFTGDLSLGNGRFSLDDGQNEAFAGSSSIVLGSGAVFDFGSGTSNIKDLTVNADSKLESSALVIGSDTAPHNISGSFSLSSDTTITLTGVSVETDLSLTDYDGSSVSQDFITAGSVTVDADAEITLSGSGDFDNLGNLVLDYQQTQNGSAATVAETVWTVNGSLTQNGNAFQVGTQLKEIRLIGNTILSGSGTSNELSALVTDSDTDGSHSLQFSSADGTQTSFTIVDYAGDSVFGNSYTGATTVDSNVTVTLGTNNGFGSTSLLTAQGNVTLGDGVKQTVKGLSGTGTITLGSGAELTLDQTGSASVGNILAGTGKFIVDLGAEANELSFTNSGAGAFGGTVSLSDGTVRLASGTATQTVLSGADLVLDTDGRLIVSGSGTDRRELGGLTLNGNSQIDFSSVSMGDANSNNAQLYVSGSFTINGSNDVSVGGINLDGTKNILAADDDNGGLKQALVTANGGIDLSSGQLVIDLTDPLMKSEIKNSGSDKTVAYGVWTAGAGDDVFTVAGDTLYASLRLSEIQLADATTGLILDATGLTVGDSTTLTAKITDHDTTAGKIVFAGGDITIGGTRTDEENTYTGATDVTGGTVTLGKTNAFGKTSLLTVSGGQVAFNNQSTRIGAIKTTQDGALLGDGSITLFGTSTQTDIVGANIGLSASIAMLDGHTATIHNPQGLGKGGIGLSDGSTLILDYSDQSTAFANALTGGGTLQIGNGTDAAAVLIGGGNSGFSGSIDISAHANLLAGGSGVDDNLGTGVIRFADSTSTLRLTSASGDLTIDNALSGAGTLIVEGTSSGQHFGFETADWGSNSFGGGTLTLSSIAMRVGSTANYGSNNAAHLAQSNIVLDSNAVLEVSSGATVDTFNNLTLSGGSVSFDGMVGFNAGNDLADLKIDGTLTLGSGNIVLNLPGSSADMAGSLENGKLLDTASGGLFETLIAASGLSGGIENITLNGSGSGKRYLGTQNITGGEGNVAYGIFDYGLATSGTSLGLDFDLTGVEIVRGETLVLEEDGTLGVVVSDHGTGKSGGSLEIAADSEVLLTGANEYTGSTTVKGELTAGASGLGGTSFLSVESGGTYINSGANTVGGLDVNADGTLILSGGSGTTLAIEHGDASGSSTIAGALQGSGALSLDAGTLAVTANNGTNWTGDIDLGTSSTGATLRLNGENALRTGTVTFVNSSSEILLNHAGDLSFGNSVSGSGSFHVDLDGNDFTFTNAEADLTAGARLYLDHAGFSLDGGLNSTVAQKTEIVLGSQSTLSSSGEVDRLVWGLDLTSGGTIDLGEIDGNGGQLVFSSGGSGSGTLKLSSNQTTTITFNGSEASGGNRVDESNNGASLLAGGGTFDLDLFEGVSNLTGVTVETDGQISGGLATDGDFESTAENYYQNADSGDSADDLVAVLRRGGSGLFYYDANRDVVYMKYGIREIDLQLSNSGQGLRLDAESMTDATLSARVTGKGNIVFAGGAVTVTDSTNNYTGSTYVQSGATVTLGASNVFGKTDYLQIDAGGSVALGAGFEQTVGELSGSGSLTLGSGSSFEIDNSQRKGEGVRDEDDPAAKDALVINAAITGADAATFTINGAGASDGRADVSFGTTSNLSGTTLVFENLSTSFTSSGTSDHGYQTAASAADTVLGTNSLLTIYANNGGTAQTYDLNKLSFAGGRIDFGSVTLTTDDHTNAILHVDTLDLSQSGTIGVQATIDSGFNILDADTRSFRQTLIKYEKLTNTSNLDNLKPASSEEMPDSAIYAADDTTVLANVQWSGGLVPQDEADPNTIAMSYQAVALKLAQGGSGDGLVLNADGHDSTLSIYVTDDESVGGSGGNITYAGGNILVTHENDYTGVTKVTAGSVTLGADSGFGLTSDLQVSDGAYVNLDGYDQTAGAIHTTDAHALRGSGTLTLGIAGNELNESFISSSNSAEDAVSGFTGTVVLTNGHVLVLDSTEGLGDEATANLASGTLVVSGASGTFATTLTGAGTMKIDSGTVAIAGAGNESFSGAWLLSNSAHTTVSGSADASADDLLGTGVVNLDAGTTLTLSEQNSSTSWSIDNAFAGSGTLEVLGTNPSSLQNFAFSTDWDDSNVFEGTLSLESGIRFTVSSGSNNALNMAGADFKLGSGAELKVEKGGLVDTFKQLAVVDGSTIRFGGTLGIGAETRDLAKLQVNSLSGSGNIVIDLPADGQKVSQTIGEGDLIARDNSGFFQSLIVAETGGVNASGWLLNSNSGTASGLKQGILDANNIEVAQAEYSYGLEAGTDDGKNALGIGFDLTAVDISGGKTLTLSGEGDFDAVVKDSTGAGDLLISGNIGLTNAENEYSGMTTVSSTGKLTAGAGALGDTSGLTLQSGASYINDGENTVGTLAAQGAQLTLNGALILEDGSGNSISGGSISGEGAFTLNAGNLEIDALESEKYSGAVTLGTTSGGAHLGFVNGTTGIGSVTVTFAHDESTVSVSGMNGVTLSNTYAGNGTINVDLGGSLNVFAFNGAQGKVAEDKRFTGTLSLANAQYHLYEDETLANAGLRTNAGSLVVVNTSDKLDDRSVNVLTLGGGTIDFGSMSTDNAGSGQIATSSLNFVEGQHTTIDLALADRADTDGSSVFGTGEKLYLIEGSSLGINANELGSLVLDSSAASTTQTVTQSGENVAKLHYGSGKLDADASGLYADWTLDTVELLSNASGGFHVEESGTITAVVSGSGDVTFTGEDAVVTIAGRGNNTYTGATFVTSEAQLTLGKDEALGDTNRLAVDSDASVAFGEYDQTIGELYVGTSGHFTMSESGSLTLTNGSSLIASENADASGALLVSGSATLELRGHGAAGSLALEAGSDAEISFTRVGSDGSYETVGNRLGGSGTYIVGDGTDSTYVELTNSGNAFGVLKVLNAGHFLVNGMESGANALGGADLTIASGAYAELNGSSGWTFDNVLDIDEGGELALSAGGSGNAFNFAETNQRIDGTVTLTDLMLTIGGASGSDNAAVLDSASVVAGSNSHVHVALGNVADDRQQVKDFTLSSGAEITFDGQLGMSGVGANVLGQMDVSGTLTLDSGSTVHVSVDPNTGASSTVAQDRLVETAASGSFQNLITAGAIDGSAVSDDGTVTGIGLTDSSGNALQTVRADIKNGSDTVAVGTFGSSLLVSGSSFGVRYGLQAIDIVGDLTISESGSFSAKISSTSGTGSLTVSAGENLTLTGENDYTVATMVTGILTADKKALGNTKSLTISNGGQFINAGANEVGELESSGKMTLNALLTVTNDQDGESHVSGTLAGNGGLMINSGSLVSTAVSEPTSGYTGTVTLGTSDTDAHLTLEAAAGAQIGSGTIEFANADSSLTINTSGASVLGNLLSGVGQVTVSGTNGESFAFKKGQEGKDIDFAGTLTLTNVEYDFTTDANDILNDVSLTVNNGTTLVLNKADDTATRKINGMSLNGGRIDFGTIGNGSGHIDLQGQSLSTSTVADTTFSLETDLADRQDASGSAAFDTVIDDSVLLIGNIAAATPESVLDGLAFADNGQAFTRDLTQGTETTARIHGKLGGLVLAGNDDGTKNIEAGLVNESLELLTTYNVRDSGSITLKIFGSGSLAVYNELKLTNGANSYKGDTTVFGAGAVLTLGADGALGQADSHTGELSVTDGAKVDFGSTSQTIGSITAEGTDALVSADQTNGKLTIADGGTVSGVNSGFHTAVELSDGSAGLTLTNVDALGQASITTLGSNTDLVLSGADGEFDNIVAGSGGLSIVNGANVTLTGENTFAGTLTVDSDSSVAASGDVFLHIVGGSLELEGSADFTQTTFADEHSVWKWNRTVNGSGNLSLSTDGAHELVLESGLGNFKGNLTLGNLQMTLSSGGNIMQSLAALSGSKIKSLILDADADLHLEGATTLSTGADNFGVTMKSGGSFVFEGIAVPGSEETATNTTHLTIDGNLTLEKGFELSLSTEEDAKVDPTNGKSLLEQDDDGMSISVITAHNIALDGFKDINDGGSVTLDGGRDTIFEIVDGDGNVVADGHYAFEIGLTDETDSDTLNLSYKLDQVMIRGGQELELAGGNDGSAVENTLSAKLSGSGNLSIKSGVVTLANSNNDFTGATTVQSEAVLYAESGALGSDSGAATSILTVAEKASAYIEGNNTVDGLMVSRGEGEETTGVLHIGASDDNVTLTLRSSTSETDPANHIYGTLSGAGTLRVLGNGQVHEGVDPDLTIHSSQERFDGDVQLESGAWVKIDADKSNLFGNSLVHTKISIDKGSLLTIESRYDGEGSFAGIFTNGANDLGGTVEIKLLNASDLFRFTTDQDTAHFNGTFVLDQGTIDYTRLYSSASGGNNAVLADATLQLNDNGNLKLFDTDETGNGSASDVNLGGLTLDGGNIAFGSINYDAGHESAVSGAHAMHINLGGDGVLALNSVGEGEVGRTSTVTISQNETNNISAGGSELLAADDGTSIVLIHNIGSLEINGKNVTGEYANGASIGSDYLQLQNEAGETQLLAQQLGGSGDYVDVAEVVRTFDNELTFGQSTINGENGKYAVSLGYTVDRVGLLHQTRAVSADDFADETVDNSLWQGLTITASDSEDPKRNEFSALITDGSNGEAGNLVLRGNETARDAVLTITGPENDAGEFTGNTYTGKTWVTAGANIALGANSAFGSTQALRVDSGSTVDFGIYDQTVGGLFALGDEALQSDEGSLITVKEDAVIRGSNTNLFGNITFEGDAEINNAVGLGTGTVTLAGNGSQLEINGASDAAGGKFANTLVGGENTSVQMSGSDIVLGTDQLEKYEGSFNLVKSELDLSIKPAESDETVLGNVITTDVDSTLSASLGDGTKNFIFAEGSKIAGQLAISNGAFNLSDERNLSALDKTDLVIGDAGRLEIASDIGAEDVDNLTLDKDSTIAFSGGGTPGSAGYDDSKGHLDLGDGTLTVNGNIGVEVDVGMVNADLVEDAKHDVSNLPLTAQDVLTADQGGHILANLVEAGKVVNDEGSFTLTVTGGEYDPTNSRLEVGIFNDGSTDEVAKGIYDYTVRLTEDGLNLSYGLTGVELIKDQTLSLKGYAETDDIDNTLSIAVTGDGSMSIDAGTITLTGQNGYKGATTVAGGATLVTGIGGKALGETSSLNLEDSADGLVGARAEIHGDETVGALNIDAKSTLALGAAAENDRTEFTIKNTAGVESTVNGQITGGRDSLITVIGNADSNDHDLVVTSANNNFYGDVTLQDAYVRLESINSFGSEGILRIDNKSTLEINSNADDAQTVTDDDGTIYTYHKFENLISGDGTVRVALDDADDYFDFAEDQYKYPSGDDQAFTGTLELAVGKFRFTDRKADVLESVHVKLDGDATLDVSADTSETTDRTMRGLTLAGGTLEFGSLALDREQAEARATHIDLNGYDLTLEDSDRQVEVSFRQDATNYISDAGSEVVNAADGDGSKIVLIHDIGKLVVDGQAIATAEDAQAVLQDYLKHEFADNAEDQILHQSIAGAGQEADVQQVARVNREFGDFGYADMSAQNLGNALYVGYEINSIELLYRGSNNEAYGADGVWKGLTVSTSDLSNQLKAQLTGQGNLVVTGGTGGTLLIGDASTETEYNNYTGRTWVTGNAKVEFAEDNAFGNTSHLRVDVGSSVNLGGDASGGGFSQTVGSLVTYDENALIGGKDASVTVTGSAQIAGNNSGFYGNLIFDTEQITTGTVTDVEGLGQGDVYIGENYQLQVTDIADADGGSILLENDIFDVNGKGGLLQIGSGLSKPEHESTTIIDGNNSNFSGNIRVEDGWAISAEVGESEDIADRLGTGSLTLAGDASATIDFGSSDVEWNHNVDGRGTLNVTTDADKTVSIGSGLGSGFEGTFTVGGGRFELADNADKLGNGNLAASGGNASIIVSGDGPVEFGNNLTITGSNEDRGQLVFEDPIKLSDNGSPELIVDGNLTLKGADVSVSVDGELEAGQGPSDALDMSSITMADEGAIDYVIAKAGLIDMSDTTLSLETGGSGNAMMVDITDGGKKVATGKYDFGLSVSTDRTELGLSYKLVEVEIDDADTLLGLQGAVSGSTSAADWANASEFSANITGAGGISLVNGNLTLTGAKNDYHGATVVYDGAVLTVESSLDNTSLVTVAEGGRLVNASDSTKAGAVNVAGRLDLEAGSKLSLKEGGESSITGSITGSGNLALLSNASVVVTAGSGYEAFTGSVTMEEGAEYALSASNGSTVIVRNNFADSKNSAGGTVRFDKASGSSSANYSLAGSAVGFTGTFELGDNVVVSANSIEAIGGEGSELLITTGKVGDEIDKATLSFEYDDKLVGQNDSLRITQGMTEGITFEKSGDGVVDLSDNAMGAGKVDVKEGGVLFGTADRESAYGTALEIAEGAWAAGFGGVSSLKVDLGGSFYVGGRSGYNSVLASTVAKVANEDPANNPPTADNTVDFVVNGSVTNAGTIYVGNKNADGSAPADSSSIGNELVIKGDYNVTASDKDGVGTGGIFDMNAIIAGDDSIADHVTITGKINGNGYVDVNYDSTVSTGGTLEYLGLVKVEGGDDGESLWLKDEVKIGDLWYRLMWSSEQNEYYLQSSVTDPGDKPWDTEDVENVNAGTRSALAFMQAQAFDLSLRGHLGETLYVDPVTGEQRKSSFWMVQRGDWTKFSNASGQMDADGNLYTTHLGTDLFKRETDGATFRWGVLAGFADGDFDVSSNVDGKTSKGSFRGYSAGLYMTAESKAESGPFLGLQLRWNRFDSEVGQDDYDVNGLSLTAEASWDQLLSKGITDGGRNYEWRLEPHVRAYWTNFGDPDDWTSSLGETYSSDFDNGLLVRVGARTKIQTTLGTGPAWQAYAEANWVYNNGDYSTTMSTKYGDVTSTQNGAEFAEFRLGLEAQFTTNVNVWLEGHHQTGSDDYESTGAMFGFKYMW